MPVSTVIIPFVRTFQAPARDCWSRRGCALMEGTKRKRVVVVIRDVIVSQEWT